MAHPPAFDPGPAVRPPDPADHPLSPPAEGRPAREPLPPGWRRVLPGPPWRIWEALALLAAFFGAQLLFSALTAAVVRQFLPPGDEEAELTTLMLYSLPAGLLASYLLGGAAVYWLLARRHRVPVLDSLGLGPFPAGRLAAPLGGGIALQFVSALLVALGPPPDEYEFLFDVFLRGGAWSIALFFAVAVGLAPLIEETFFRGLLLPALVRRYGFAPSALLVTLLFTALHAFQTGLYWPALTSIFLCGWILAWLRQRHGVLWPSVAFHIGFNFTAFLPVLLLGDKLH